MGTGSRRFAPNGGPTGEWSRRPSLDLAAVGYAASSTSSEGLVQWDPLHEPDQFIDVRKLLAKSGSPSRRNPMHCQHRHQLRSLTLQGHELPLDRGWPPAFDDDRPPSLRKERTHKHLPPQRPDAEQQALLDDMPLTNCERIWGGMKARISVVHRRVGPRSGYARQTRPPGASGGEGGALACTYRIFAGNRG